MRYKHHPAGNLPVPQLLQDFIDSRQRSSCHLTADLTGGCHCEQFAHIPSRSDRRSLDAQL